MTNAILARRTYNDNTLLLVAVAMSTEAIEERVASESSQVRYQPKAYHDVFERIVGNMVTYSTIEVVAALVGLRTEAITREEGSYIGHTVLICKVDGVLTAAAFYTPEQISKLELMGTYFGYPQCCIESHRDTTCSNDWVDALGSKIDMLEGTTLAGRGYFPCDSCIRDTTKFNQLILMINHHRYCPYEFSAGSPIDLVYINQLLALEMYINGHLEDHRWTNH